MPSEVLSVRTECGNGCDVVGAKLVYLSTADCVCLSFPWECAFMQSVLL